MREIKFRGKLIDVNEWVYGSYMDSYFSSRYGLVTAIFSNDYELNKTYRIPVSKETIGQFTGLKDKNGKEIYEGDIVQDAWRIDMVVKYINTGFYLCRKNVNGEYSKISNWRNLDTKEVIGNIYDNPELLKEE